MTTITIKNYRSLISANLDLSGPLTLICAVNNQGKSSAIGAIAAATTGIPLPLGMTKAEAPKVITSGQDAAGIDLISSSGARRVRLPGCEVKTEGQPLICTNVAAGIASLVDMAVKDRASALATLLKSEPDRADLAREMKAKDLPEEAVETVWKKIEAVEWEGAHKWAAENGTKSKGAWEQITADRYGSAKALSWKPAGWHDDLDMISDGAALEQKAKDAAEAYESAIKGGAVDDAKASSLKIAAESAGAVEQRAADLVEKIDMMESGILTLERERETLGRPGYIGQPCPHCAGMVVVEPQPNGKPAILSKAATSMTEAEVKVINLKIASVDGKLSKLRADLSGLKRDHERTLDDLVSAQAAAETLSRAEDTPATDISGIKAGLETANARVAMFNKRAEALTKATQVANNQILIDILAPVGIRQTKAVESMVAFNVRLESLCETAGWPVVKISNDLAFYYGQRPYALCSASEQWRLRVVLQVAQAQIDRSAMVLIDGADILTGKARNALFTMLLGSEVPAVIGMSVAKPSMAPDLATMGCGATFWISEGSAKPIGEMVKTA